MKIIINWNSFFSLFYSDSIEWTILCVISCSAMCVNRISFCFCFIYAIFLNPSISNMYFFLIYATLWQILDKVVGFLYYDLILIFRYFRISNRIFFFCYSGIYYNSSVFCFQGCLERGSGAIFPFNSGSFLLPFIFILYSFS